jgi:hypothetical protein
MCGKSGASRDASVQKTANKPLSASATLWHGRAKFDPERSGTLMRHATAGLVLALLGALALSGCGDKTETKTATATATSDVAAPATDAGPVRKAGLWEQTTSAEGMGSATTKICLGAAVTPACPGAKAEKTADGYTMSATCQAGGATMAVEGVANGDLQSAYTLTAKTTITPPGAGAKSQVMNATYSLRYVGPCPEGMTVGQVQSDEGAVIDMSHYDAAKARAMAKQAAGK